MCYIGIELFSPGVAPFLLSTLMLHSLGWQIGRGTKVSNRGEPGSAEIPENGENPCPVFGSFRYFCGLKSFITHEWCIKRGS